MAANKIAIEVGGVYGDWTVTEHLGIKGKATLTYWRMICPKGHVRETHSAEIRRSSLKPCGKCSEKLRFDAYAVGTKIGSRTIMSEPSMRGRRHHYLCLCDCGREDYVSHLSLSRRVADKCPQCARSTHGFCRRDSLVQDEYAIWAGMKSRCENESDYSFRLYGGRGICVCDSWSSSFESFYRDIGPRPSKKHTLDRIDVNGDYCPENCRWATIDVQANNRRTNIRINCNGEELTGSQLDRRLGFNRGVVARRKAKGWTDEEIISTPVHGYTIEHDGLSLTLQQWADRIQISRVALANRLKKGMPFAEAISKPPQAWTRHRRKQAQ